LEIKRETNIDATLKKVVFIISLVRLKKSLWFGEEVRVSLRNRFDS